jgi:hypothetical protein
MYRREVDMIQFKEKKEKESLLSRKKGKEKHGE